MDFHDYKKALDKSGIMETFADSELHCIDIGARGGFFSDLLPLASRINMYGCEPDPEEYNEISSSDNQTSPWKSVQNLPVAIGKKAKERKLYICNKEGCSSFLKPLPNHAQNFQRKAYYEVKKQLKIDTLPLHEIKEKYQIPHVDYVKMDVQGLEKEICQASEELFKNEILFIRCESTWESFYKNQTLPEELFKFFRENNFIFLDFEESHKWRLYSKRKDQQLEPDGLPFSRGQLIHGDLLFVKNPFSPTDWAKSKKSINRCLLLLLAHGFVDHAKKILKTSNQFPNSEKLNNKIMSYSQILGKYKLTQDFFEIFNSIQNFFKQIGRYIRNL